MLSPPSCLGLESQESQERTDSAGAGDLSVSAEIRGEI